ncbi:Hypothetical predicted protein, partial [Marmota monax]
GPGSRGSGTGGLAAPPAQQATTWGGRGWGAPAPRPRFAPAVTSEPDRVNRARRPSAGRRLRPRAADGRSPRRPGGAGVRSLQAAASDTRYASPVLSPARRGGERVGESGEDRKPHAGAPGAPGKRAAGLTESGVHGALEPAKRGDPRARRAAGQPEPSGPRSVPDDAPCARGDALAA